jgi:predicted phosphoadenosine phosphosulfate sulfurtransferase
MQKKVNDIWNERKKYEANYNSILSQFYQHFKIFDDASDSAVNCADFSL